MKKTQIKIGAILSYLVLSLNMIVGIIYTPILTRILGQAEYGIYSLVASIISYLTVLDLGLGNAIIIFTAKFRASEKKEEEKKLHGMLFLINIVTGFIATIIGIILYLNVNKIFGSSMSVTEIETAKKLMLMLVLNLAITFPFSIFGNIVAAYERFIFGKILKIIQILLIPLISVPVLLLGYKSFALVMIITLVNIFCLSVNAWYCFKKIGVKLSFKKFDFKLLKEVFSYSFYIFLNQIIDRINWSTDQFVLGSVSGAITVAIYNIASQLNQTYLSFSTAISGVLLPKVAMMQERKASDKEFTDLFTKTGRIQYAIMGLVITGFVLFGSYFINLWAGSGYKDAYLIACVLMIPVTIPLIQNVGINILQAKNKNKFRTVLYFFMALFNIAASIPLAKLYGGLGAAIPTAFALLIGNGLIINIYYYKTIGINIIEFWKNILRMTIPLLFVLGFGIGINLFLPNTTKIIYLTKILIYTIIYVIIMWRFAFNDSEKRTFKKPFNIILNKFRK